MSDFFTKAIVVLQDLDGKMRVANGVQVAIIPPLVVMKHETHLHVVPLERNRRGPF